MLSRGNSNVSVRLRRTNSAASVKKGGLALEMKRIDPDVVHQDALIAANIAFDRGASVLRTSSDRYKPISNYEYSTERYQHGRPLRRRQSVRFTGPTAVTIHQRPITRRNAPSYVHTASATQHRELELLRFESTITLTEHPLTALPQVESVSSTPLSHRKLRKSKSMFTPRKGSPLMFSNATPNSIELQRNCYRGVSSDDQRPFPKMASVGLVSPLLRGTDVHLNGPYQHQYDQDAAIQMARDQYLHQLEQQRLKGHPSKLNLRQRGSQKALRRTVRTSSTNSYGNAAVSEAKPTSIKSTGFGNRARTISTTLKNKLMSVFHRSESPRNIFPSQQVEAKRAHFGDHLLATSGVEHEGPLPPTPDRELLSRVGSRSPSIHRMPVHLTRGASPGSIRSVRSRSPSIGRSRITSWTNSTAANSLTKQQILEKKRLSIIQEHGGPHQPSSSAGLIGVAARKGYAVFRKPLRGVAGSIKDAGQLDSQRIYSALQRRLDEHNTIDSKHEPERLRNSGLLRQASNESLRLYSLGSQGPSLETIRVLPYETDDSSVRPHSTSVVDAIGFSTDPSTQGLPDDIFRSSPTSSIKRKPVRAVRSSSERELTYQQIAERNESLGHSRRRPLREVKSAFFPSTVHYQSTNPSPYRRAVKSSIEENRDIDTREINGYTETIHKSTERRLKTPIAASISSSSIYSGSTNGTAKLLEASPSLSRSQSSCVAVTATIVDIAPSMPLRPAVTAATAPARRTSSSTTAADEWKGWMHSEIKSLDGQNRADMGILGTSHKRQSTHQREDAQIDGDDVIIGYHQKKSLGFKQPLGIIQANAASRPVLGHKASDQSIEKVPLRYPMIERTISIEAIALARKVPIVVSLPATPPGTASNPRGSSYSSSQKHLNRDELSQKAPQTPLTPNIGYTDGSRILTENKNFNAPQQCDIPANIYSRSPCTNGLRCSPERAERLRRMQSSHLMRSKENMRTQDHGFRTGAHLQENLAMNYLSPTPSPRNEVETKVGGLLEPITTEIQAAGSQKMVELFLSKRRNGVVVGEGSSPVFI